MFKYIPILAAVLLATPAAAQNFVGPRAELNGGVLDTRTDNVDYGAAVGADTTIAPRLTIGAEVNTANTLDDNAREFGAAARLGFLAHPNALVYGRVGYNTIRLDNAPNLDGVEVGGGVELKLNRNLFTGLEYRYGNFDRGYDRRGLMARIGFRF